jgi:hypothetical protein
MNLSRCIYGTMAPSWTEILNILLGLAWLGIAIIAMHVRA